MALDVLIRGGTVFDGSNNPPVHADVGVVAGRIVSVGVVTDEAIEVIDARGKAVTPGFIDIHSHSDYTLLIDPRAVSSVAQGVTTEVIGNCGFGCAPIGDPRLAPNAIYGYDASIPLAWSGIGEYLEKLESVRPAVNVLTLVGNGQLRLASVGLADRAASEIEIGRMRGLLRQGLSEGAVGYSIGLEYPSEVGCGERELVELAREAGRAGGFYATHTRNRAEGAVAAVEEAIRTARDAEVRLQVSHLMPRSGDTICEQCVEVVDAARARGQDISFDMHTRLYGTTMLSTLLPPWVFNDGIAGVRRNLSDGASRARIKSFAGLIASLRDWDKVQLLDLPGRPDVSRLTLGQIGRRRGRDPHDCALDILLDEVETLHRPMVILHAYTEASQKLAFTHPLCMPGSDATTLAPDGPLSSSVFHGAYTWASWFWRAMVREWKLLKPEQAVNRLTGLPASVLGLTDRGTLKVGARADISVFDPATFGERATTFEPNQLAQGMSDVLVNGMPVMRAGERTATRSGMVVRRRGPALEC
ncbi:MAG: amidohydrolase family protein [Gammaproteobacteria bacterium]